MRAAIWVRVSTEGQDEGYSPESQLRDCRALCDENGWTVATEYRVVFSAAWAEDIPEWQSLMAAIRRRDIDVLVVLKYDRLARHHWDVGTMLRSCERHGVKVVFVKDEIPEGEYGDIFVFMKGFSGYRARQDIIEAAGRGQQEKMRGNPANGVSPRPLGSQSEPFGMRWVQEYETRGGATRLTKRRLEPDPDTADALQSIFRWYDEGMSLQGVADRLDAMGVMPPNRSRTGTTTWSRATIRAILTNENYIGVGHAGKTKKISKHERINLPRDQWIPLPDGTFPAMIEEAVFVRVGGRLTQNRNNCPPGNRDPQMGLLRRGTGVCGYCGKPLKVSRNGRGPVYHCTPEHRKQYGCPSFKMMAERLDDEVWHFVRNLFLRPGALETKLFGDPPPDPTVALLPLAEAEVKRLSKERERIQRRLRETDDDMLAAAYEQDLKSLLEEAQVANARYRALIAEREACRVAQEQRHHVLNEVDQLRHQLDDLDWLGRRSLLTRIRAKVELFSERDADPRWRISTGFTASPRYSISSNTPFLDSPFGVQAPLTIVIGDEIDGEEALNVYSHSRVTASNIQAPAPIWRLLLEEPRHIDCDAGKRGRANDSLSIDALVV